MATCLAVTYTPCATSSSKSKFTQFEEGNELTKTYNNAESGDESKYNSIILPLLIKEEMYAMDSGNESDHDLISTVM